MFVLILFLSCSSYGCPSAVIPYKYTTSEECEIAGMRSLSAKKKDEKISRAAVRYFACVQQ